MKQRHSRAYHRYFEDFAEKKYNDAKGRPRIERIYVGSYYRRNTSDQKHRVFKLVYAAMYILSLVAFLYAGSRDAQANLTIYAVLPITLSLISMICLFIPLFYSVTAPREMMIRVYRISSERLTAFSLLAAALMALNAVIAVMSVFLIPGAAVCGQYQSIAGFLVSALILLSLWRMEKQMDYEELPPRNERPPKAPIIKF